MPEKVSLSKTFPGELMLKSQQLESADANRFFIESFAFAFGRFCTNILPFWRTVLQTIITQFLTDSFRQTPLALNFSFIQFNYSAFIVI